MAFSAQTTASFFLLNFDHNIGFWENNNNLYTEDWQNLKKIQIS
jgi:hypothetical protein